ncbi:MAG: MBL fold metallo-hydrolase [Gemmataceae bacterium]
MRVTFLGVGAALPGPGQTNCAYLIDVPGACLLFDCGPAILQQFDAASRSPGEVTHVFVSHAHGDHGLGWPMFALWWGLGGRGALPTVITSAVTWNRLRGLWLLSFDDVPAAAFPWVEAGPGVTAHDLGAFRLTAVPMRHSTTSPVLGARVEAGGKVAAFTADTARTDAVVGLAKDADLLVHDARHAATFLPDEVQHRFHTTARDAGDYAREAGAKALALVHLGAEYAGNEARLVGEARFGGEVFAPRGGDVVRV